MKSRVVFPFVAVALLALSACSGGAPATPGSPAAPPAGSSSQTSEKPSGAEATVTFDGHVYEFSSDPALTWGKVAVSPCGEWMSTLDLNLWPVAIDGQPAEELDGSLALEVSDPVRTSANQLEMSVKSTGVNILAGGEKKIAGVQLPPITLTRDGYTISGSQDVYNRVTDAPEPRVISVQVDARCVDF